MQKNLFKAGKGKRPSGTTDYALPLQDGDPSYVFAPNIVSLASVQLDAKLRTSAAF